MDELVESIAMYAKQPARLRNRDDIPCLVCFSGKKRVYHHIEHQPCITLQFRIAENKRAH